MNKTLKSFQENAESILKELPKEFHEVAKKEIESVKDLESNTPERELEMIKKELLDHPDIDASIIKDINPKEHRSPKPPSEDEQKKAMEAELKATMATCSE